jgi:hypothetical protein
MEIHRSIDRDEIMEEAGNEQEQTITLQNRRG